MNRFYALTISLLIFLAPKSFAQLLPPLQPEQDACNALQLCGNAFFSPYSYQGEGLLTDIVATPCSGFENNSMWLKVTVNTAGTIVFTITPVVVADDYDFAIVDGTNTPCNNLASAPIVRCNFNNNQPVFNNGVVGLNNTSVQPYVGAGVTGNSFLQQITAAAGDVYYIMINNYGAQGGPSSGFTIDFTGSTATFVGGAPPSFDSIAKKCSYADSLHVYLNHNIKCPSLQSNGSDFVLVPPAATITSAVGGSCSGSNGYTSDIYLTFSNTLPPGTYALKANTGTDGNTLLDVCNVPQLLSDTITFVVPPTLSVDPGPDTVTCVNNSYQLNARIVGGNYPAYTYVWTPATYLSSTTIPNPVSSPSNAISYTVTAIPTAMPACSVSKSVRIDVLQGFDLTNNDTAICYGASVQLNAVGDNRYTYTWTPGTGLDNPNIPNPVSTPAVATTYTVTARRAGCRDSLQQVTIDVQPGPTVNIGPDLTLCYGDTLTMQPTIVPDTFANYNYDWTPANVFNFANIRNPLYTATDTANIKLTVKTPAGCIGEDTRVINVIPNNFITISNDTGICPGYTPQLHVSGGDIYRWTPALWLSNDTIPDPVAMPQVTTTYTVYATNNAFGCRDTGMVTVTVYPRAVISLPDSVQLYPGESYSINPGGNCLYFQWFPPAGLSSANISNPVATPEVNTRYFVTASTESGCVTNDSMDINVALESMIDMPNAFSPGSAPNDIFKPVYRGNVQLTYLRVYDRWGQKVFESNNINNGWDGTFNGKPQGLGVFVYEVEAKLPSGKIFKKQGNVTLIR